MMPTRSRSAEPNMTRSSRFLCGLAVFSCFVAMGAAPAVARGQAPDGPRDGLGRVVDATGQPIAGAKVVITFDDRGKNDELAATAHLVTDGSGMIPIASDARGARTGSMQITHPDFGTARRTIDGLADTRDMFVPLVKTGSEAAKRALRGKVVGPDGKPLAGTAVECREIRTPGEGLIQPAEVTAVLTDEAGAFALYVPDPNPRAERGELIPPQSRFFVVVEAADDLTLFPHAGNHLNSEEATIRLQRPQKVHRFRFERLGGGFVDDPQELQNFGVSHYMIAPHVDGLVMPRRYVTFGGPMPPGPVPGVAVLDGV
jgi:hypothetical protein